MSIESLILIKAEIFLLLSICFILIFDVFISSSQRVITFWLSLAAVIITAILSLSTLNNDTTILFSGSVVIDQISSMLKAFSSFLLAICFIYSKEYITDIENYNHNHVLRAMLNTTFGESIGNSFVDGDIWQKDYSINISTLELGLSLKLSYS